MKALNAIFLITLFCSARAEAFPHLNQLKRNYDNGKYEKVLELITEIQNKGTDNAYIYKYKGIYRYNPDLYFYKYKSEFNLAIKNSDTKLLNTALSDYSHLISFSNLSDTSISDYLKVQAEISYSIKDKKNTEYYCLYLARVFKDTISIYRKLYEPWFNYPQVIMWKQIDSLAQLKPPFRIQNTKQLATYLTKGLCDEQDKARAIYSWIVSHIRYNYEGYKKGTYGDNTPFGVIKNRKAVCYGYALLMVELCSKAGLQSQLIMGYAKGASYRASNTPEINHAWCAVYFDSKWNLMETTWASCTGFVDYYFAVKPELLIKTHYPSENSFQLLPRVLSIEEFIRLQ